MKRPFSRLSKPLLVNWHGNRKTLYPYYRIKTEICTHRACTAIGKLIEMTVPRGAMGCLLYAAQPIRRPELSHMTPHHHCKQQWQIVKKNPSILSNISFWYQDVEVSKDFQLLIWNSLGLCTPVEP